MICLKAIRCDAHDPNRRRSVRATFQILLLLSIAATHAAHAENGRDFSAMYDLTNIAPVDTAHVSLTLVLRLQNHSGADIADAVVGLSDRLRPGKLSAQVSSGVSIQYGRHVKVSGDITVKRSDYDRWQHGARLPLVIEFRDARGHTTTRPIELVRMPGIGARK
jgi:hypothetical protein